MMGDHAPLMFEGGSPSILVSLSTSALRVIERQALAAPEHETGGILIGRYTEDNNMALVFAATAKPKDSERGRTWFRRGNRGLKELLRERWNAGEYYVGEWHSHPGGPPTPSDSDIREMRTISLDPCYACSKPILVIAGTTKNSISLSVSVIGDNAVKPLMVVKRFAEIS